MDFEEWFESRDDIGCLIGLEGYAANEAWNARQAEIDALKAEVISIINSITPYEYDLDTMGKINKIKELLK